MSKWSKQGCLFSVTILIYLQSAVELETGSREQSSATNCQAGVTTWVSLGYGASDAWCEGSCVRERVVWPGGGGGGRRRLWRRSTPQQAFNQYPATTLIINNNNNTLKLTLISNRGTPLRGARTNPVLYWRRHAHASPIMGRMHHGPHIGLYCFLSLIVICTILMFICMSPFCLNVIFLLK